MLSYWPLVWYNNLSKYREVAAMEERKLTTEELEQISRLQEQKESQEHYTERPLSHRILAWACAGLVVVGLILMLYWMVTPVV